MSLGNIIGSSAVDTDLCSSIVDLLCVHISSDSVWMQFGCAVALGTAAVHVAQTSSTALLEIIGLLQDMILKPREVQLADDTYCIVIGAGIGLGRACKAAAGLSETGSLRKLYDTFSKALTASLQSISSPSSINISIGVLAALPAIVGWCLRLDLMSPNHMHQLMENVVKFSEPSVHSICPTLYLLGCCCLGSLVRVVVAEGYELNSACSIETCCAKFSDVQIKSALRAGVLLGGACLLGAQLLPAPSPLPNTRDIIDNVTHAPSMNNILQALRRSVQDDMEPRTIRYVAWAYGRLAVTTAIQPDSETSTGVLSQAVALERMPLDSTLRLLMQRLFSDNLSHTTYAGVISSLTYCTRIPPIDWPTLLTRFMKFSTGNEELRKSCVRFALKHATTSDTPLALSSLLTFSHALLELSRLRSLSVEVREVIYSYLPRLLIISPITRASEILNDTILPMLTSTSIVETKQLYSALQLCAKQQDISSQLSSAICSAIIKLTVSLSQPLSSVSMELDEIAQILQYLGPEQIAPAVSVNALGGKAIYLGAKLVAMKVLPPDTLREARNWLISDIPAATSAQCVIPLLVHSMCSVGDVTRWLTDALDSIALAPVPSHAIMITVCLCARIVNGAAWVQLAHSQSYTTTEALYSKLPLLLPCVLSAAMMIDRWQPQALDALLSSCVGLFTQTAGTPLEQIIMQTLVAMRHTNRLRTEQLWLRIVDSALQ